MLKFLVALKVSFKKSGKKLNATLAFWVLILPFVEGKLFLKTASAQPIRPAPDGTGTQVIPNPLPGTPTPQVRFDIQGGQLSRDGASLFHSFQRFNLREGQIANFISNPAIQNILGRVVGGTPSLINGLIQVTGGNANLYLMNPAGIIFGSNASLNVPGDFIATTANGIGFNSGIFTATGLTSYQSLVGTPSALIFGKEGTGIVLNQGDLTVSPGHNLMLAGRAVINEGKLNAPNGTVTMTPVPEAGIIRITQSGHLLSLEVKMEDKFAAAKSPELLPVKLPQMLTGGNRPDATTVTLNGNNQIVLVKPELPGNPLNNSPDLGVKPPLPGGGNPLTIVLQEGNNIPGGIQGLPPLVMGDFTAKLAMGPVLPLNGAGLDMKGPGSGGVFPLSPGQFPLSEAGPMMAGVPMPGTPMGMRFNVGQAPRTGEVPQFNHNSSPPPPPPNPMGLGTQIAMRREQQFAETFQDSLLNQRVTPQSIRETLDTIATKTGNHSAIIYVSAFEDQLELVMFPPNGTPIRKTVPEAKRDVLITVARRFRSEITNPRKLNTASYLPAAQQLYQWLIAPLEEDLQKDGINTLLFSMDVGLRTMPLAALHDGKQFLIEKYSFSLIPSLSLTDTRYQSLQNASVLAMGASQFKDLNPLPAVPVELTEIVGKLWPGLSFLNQDFTVNNLKSQRSRYPYQIIHLATHGEFHAGDSQNSFIQLWDERLQLNQLRQLGWNDPPVELLVLSSCRTGVGDQETELGFAGLAFQAGVKSALASLWYVSDRGTLALMTEFYQHLRQSAVKAEALRQAQIAMLKGEVRIEAGVLRGSGMSEAGGNVRRGVPLPPEVSGPGPTNLAHPYYWSAFMLVGSPW